MSDDYDFSECAMDANESKRIILESANWIACFAPHDLKA
jgi:hypothetical protein